MDLCAGARLVKARGAIPVDDFRVAPRRLGALVNERQGRHGQAEQQGCEQPVGDSWWPAQRLHRSDGSNESIQQQNRQNGKKKSPHLLVERPHQEGRQVSRGHACVRFAVEQSQRHAGERQAADRCRENHACRASFHPEQHQGSDPALGHGVRLFRQALARAGQEALRAKVHVGLLDHDSRVVIGGRGRAQQNPESVGGKGGERRTHRVPPPAPARDRPQRIHRDHRQRRGARQHHRRHEQRQQPKFVPRSLLERPERRQEQQAEQRLA